MDKKTIRFWKNKFPRLFYFLIKSPVLSRMISSFDWFKYRFCLATNKPYFGVMFLASQTWEERKNWMRKLVTQEASNKKGVNFNILEIGSWAGNSSVLWADSIKQAGHNGMVLCIDSWAPYIKNKGNEKVNSAILLMDEFLVKDKVFNLFLHNIKASGNRDIIYPIKAPSVRILPFLSLNSFNLVYIDGDHSYSGIKKDLEYASNLVCVGGIICGDDLDISIGDIDREFAQKNRETNMIIDPQTKQAYHPGVCLAVFDFFGTEVSCYQGFWAMRKTGSGWEKVNILG